MHNPLVLREIQDYLLCSILPVTLKIFKVKTKFFQNGIGALLLLIILNQPSPIFSAVQNKEVAKMSFSDTIPGATFNVWTSAWNQNGRSYISQTHIRAFQLPISSVQNVLNQSPESLSLIHI